MDVYLGPYFRCRVREAEKRKVAICKNKDCIYYLSEYADTKDHLFCYRCGSRLTLGPTQLEESLFRGVPLLSDVQEKVPTLFSFSMVHRKGRVVPEYHRWVPCFDARAGEDPRLYLNIKKEGVEEIVLEFPEVIQQEREWMINSFDEELIILNQLYDEVLVLWGLMVYDKDPLRVLD